MSTHYPKAPLTEALIDIRVALPPSMAVTDLAKVRSGEEERYPLEAGHYQLTSQIEINSAERSSATSAKQTQTGHVFRTTDERQVWQVRFDGFTFSRLAPYDRWETMRDEARRLWQLYRQVLQPQSITRIAVRYINRLELPISEEQSLDYKDYLRTGPEVSPGLPQGLAGFFMQLQMPQDDLSAMLILTEATVPSGNARVGSVLLDIDLFREIDLPQDDDSLWLLFERFRVRKNDTFEGSITDRLREMIS